MYMCSFAHTHVEVGFADHVYVYNYMCVYIGYIILYRREASIGLIVTYVIYVQVGLTAFFISCWKGHVAVVQLLLQKHADVSICSTVC